eukprot:c20347_g1_i1.p1 GENE.c20347_g1_i1~~c20347_g1_i1.p1  ORF type:complete len:359 (+),score=156.77 c20347_g1_i1:26-1078(+)
MSVRISLNEVTELCLKALERSGLSKNGCQAIAKTITDAERDGCKSHGLFRLPGWCASLRSGKINPHAQPSVTILPNTSVVKVDGQRCVFPLALSVGLPVLIDVTKKNGIGIMVAKDIYHFSALWHEVEELAINGLVGMAFVNTNSFVAHHGGVKRVYGTNPMAFGFPRSGPNKSYPIVFDQASSAMARGEIQLYKRDGHQLPEGVAIDKNGNPTTDPTEALAGSQLPFGGHKGTSISLMVELLSAGLTGSPFSFEAPQENEKFKDNGPTRHGEIILAIDPVKLWGDNNEESNFARVENLLGFILDGSPNARLPSQRRYAERKKTSVTGVQIPKQLYDDILSIISSNSSSL